MDDVKTTDVRGEAADVSTKKVYEAPELTEHGTVEAMTQQIAGPSTIVD